MKFKSVWHEGYYYVLGAGQRRNARIVGWILLPFALYTILLGAILTHDMERLDDPREEKL